jgi:arylsulfatase A-like enzyme
MKLKTIITVSSIAVIIGFIVGFVVSLDSIIANRYIQYKMFRLIAFTVQKGLNVMILFSLVALLILYILWFLVVQKMKYDRNRVISFIITLGVLLSVGLWFENLTGHTLPGVLRKFVTKTRDFATREIAFGDFLSLLEKHFLVIVILAACFVGMPFLFWLLAKLKWEQITKFTKTRGVREISLVLVTFLLILNLSIVADGKLNLPKGPNVILLVVDAWRADSLGCYNKNSNATPHIDDFAKNAVLFKNALAQSSCTINSAPSMFCSVYPFEHNYFNYKCSVPNKFNTIAELLKNEGYQTFGISTNPHVTGRNGLDQGFDIFIEDTIWRNTDCDEVNNRFIEWLGNNKQKRFFTMLWYIDPHNSYDPPSEYVDKYIIRKEEKENISLRTKNHSKAKKGTFTAIEKRVTKQLYTGEVNFFDTEFHKLINYLKQNGLMKNSIIILTSDHGEAFWEKGILGHGSSLYEGQIKIPLIISLPNQKDGKVIPENVQHIDILPTILEYTKTNDKTADALLLRGRSLKGLINGEKFKRKYLFSQLITSQYGPYYMECVRTDSFKLVSTYQIGKLSFAPPRLQLFDLNLEESECDAADGTSKSIFTNLKKQLFFWEGNLEKIAISPKRRKHEIKGEDEKLKERLKSLGYI